MNVLMINCGAPPGDITRFQHFSSLSGKHHTKAGVLVERFTCNKENFMTLKTV